MSYYVNSDDIIRFTQIVYGNTCININAFGNSILNTMNAVTTPTPYCVTLTPNQRGVLPTRLSFVFSPRLIGIVSVLFFALQLSNLIFKDPKVSILRGAVVIPVSNMILVGL
jgi:hypothetical protein